MKQIIETFDYNEIPERQMVTSNGKDLYWEDTQECDKVIGKRTFQLYKNGDYICSSQLPDKKATFYCCDKYGNYLPKTLLMGIKALQKQASSNLYKCNNTGAIIRKIGKPYQDTTLLSKPMRVKGKVIDHELLDTIGEVYEFLVDDLIQL